MKTVVLGSEVIEVEVKPHDLLVEYRRLLSADVQERLVCSRHLHECPCPGCGGGDRQQAFLRDGMQYWECRQCWSVYVAPRPTETELVAFYRDSPSARFWREQVLAQTREARRAKLFRPRAQWLLDAVDEYRPQTEFGIAVGYHNDLLIEELFAQKKRRLRLLVTNPLADVEFSGLQVDGLEVRPTLPQDIGALGPADLLLAFDILDRCADVDGLLAASHRALAPGGLLLLTTTLASGFDLQVLWDRSESIFPPERLNLLSTEGMAALAARHRFEVLEFSTPGMFDAEIVQRFVQSHPETEWPRFVRLLVEHRGPEALEALQEYLQRFRLSSFGRLIMRKSQ